MINIDKIIKKRRLSKKDIAHKMGLSRVSLHRILNGNPTLENINKLAAVLEIPVSELFERQDRDGFYCPHCGERIRFSK